jgi:NAD(P)-dependent dehydrogenase (short-subunit alcohol dehydrogenase family)
LENADGGREVEAAGARAHVVPCDITDRPSVNAAVAEISATLGPVWVLVNNAVYTEDKPIEDVDDADLDLVIRSGIYGSLYTADGRHAPFNEWWEMRTEAEREHHTEATPMRRMGDGEQDVSALIVFLAGPGGSFITSRTLHVDGGRWCYDR